jgi:hypothetical protein
MTETRLMVGRNLPDGGQSRWRSAKLLISLPQARSHELSLSKLERDTVSKGCRPPSICVRTVERLRQSFLACRQRVVAVAAPVPFGDRPRHHSEASGANDPTWCHVGKRSGNQPASGSHAALSKRGGNR